MRRAEKMVGLILICGLAVACGDAAPAGEQTDDQSSAATASKTPKQYLALGDSIAFGFDPTVTNPLVPSNYVGYPDVIGSWTHIAESNAACPGETSGSFLSATAPDNGCRAWRSKYPLHVSYTGTQMQYALSSVANPQTKYISIDMGANDLFLLEQNCLGNLTCIQNGLPGVITAFGTNMATIYGELKAAHFSGQLVALTTYSTDYTNALDTQALTALNGALSQVTKAAGYIVADGYGAFQLASKSSNGSPCAAGLLIKLPDGTCNIHPSKLGRELLAATVLASLAVSQ